MDGRRNHRLVPHAYASRDRTPKLGKFGALVWTLLYGLMAFAAWRVWLAAPSPERSLALALFVAQLALNLAWTWIFFRKHAVGAALIEVIALWVAIAVTMLAFRRVEPGAEWLMAPYLAWVTFASALNAAFWRLN